MQENIGWPLGKLTIDGRKQYLEKSLKYKGTVEPKYQIKTSGCLWERKSCGTTHTLDSSTLSKKTTNKNKTCTHCN